MRAFGPMGYAAGLNDVAKQAKIGEIEAHRRGRHPSYFAKSKFKYC
jgi:hypothetical protein